MTCRDEILACVDAMTAESADGVFYIKDVLAQMRRNKTRYQESTIRTQITSMLCMNAPDNHGTVYDDFVRVGNGAYCRLKSNRTQSS